MNILMLIGQILMVIAILIIGGMLYLLIKDIIYIKEIKKLDRHMQELEEVEQERKSRKIDYRIG